MTPIPYQGDVMALYLRLLHLALEAIEQIDDDA